MCPHTEGLSAPILPAQQNIISVQTNFSTPVLPEAIWVYIVQHWFPNVSGFG
jgi:hypothetical protein